MRFISKNAFVMMAIKGEGFCSSAHDAFYLIMRTKATYAIADSTCWLVIHFGKLLITIGCTVIGYVMIVNIDHFENQLYNPVAPTLVRRMNNVGVLCGQLGGVITIHGCLRDWL